MVPHSQPRNAVFYPTCPIVRELTIFDNEASSHQCATPMVASTRSSSNPVLSPNSSRTPTPPIFYQQATAPPPLPYSATGSISLLIHISPKSTHTCTL